MSNPIIIDPQAWWLYVSVPAGLLFLLLVAANWTKAYNEWQHRKTTERIETYLYLRFGPWRKP